MNFIKHGWIPTLLVISLLLAGLSNIPVSRAESLSPLGDITWAKGGMVLDVSQGQTWDSLIVGDPSIVKVGSEYRMAYYGIGYGSQGHAANGYATSIDLINWTRYAGNPTLTHGVSGSWDELHSCKPVIVQKGTVWWQFYTGVNNSDKRQIGAALSRDFNTWSKHPYNPLLRITGDSLWDGGNLEIGAVFRMPYLYGMLYGARPLGGGNSQIGIATSVDFIRWNRANSRQPVLSPGPVGSWDAGWVAPGNAVIRIGTYYVMSYTASDTPSSSGSDEPGIIQAGLAYSTDGFHWTKHPNNPIIKLGAKGDFDSKAIYRTCLFQDLGNIYIFYNAIKEEIWTDYERIGYYRAKLR